MYDPDELREQILMARLAEDIDEVRRLQNIMCGMFNRCDLCRACLGWKKGEEGHLGWSRKFEY